MHLKMTTPFARSREKKHAAMVRTWHSTPERKRTACAQIEREAELNAWVHNPARRVAMLACAKQTTKKTEVLRCFLTAIDYV